MRFALAQINTTVGDFAGNVDRILDYAGRAKEHSADLVVFPELALCGYPPRDLVEKPEFVERSERELERLAGLLKPRGYLLAFFNCERAAARPATRYRIMDSDRLEYEPLPDAHPPGRAYENREIQEFFAGFDLVNSCYLKNQMREILVQKKPVRSGRSSSSLSTRPV